MAPFKSLLVFMTIAATIGVAVGKNYTVGNPIGSWDLTTNYTQWTSTITFLPGDFLIFSYTSAHDVVEVTSGNYATCNDSSTIFSDKSGNTLIPLTSPGSRYFICSVGNHCSRGMKVQIDVASLVPAPKASPPNASPPKVSPPKASPPASPPSPPKSAATTRLGLSPQIAFGLGLALMMHMAF